MQNHISKREIFKDQAYFDEQIRYNTEMLAKFKDVIENPKTSPEHRLQLRHTVFRRQMEQLIIRYSNGEAIVTLKEYFPDIINSLAAYNDEPGHTPFNFDTFDAYIYALWMVSLAILLEVDNKSFNEIVLEINNRGRDQIYERLLALRLPNSIDDQKIMYPKPYAILSEALDSSGKEQIDLINKFLSKYYNGMKNSHWYDSHLGHDSGFFGYWCFELAAFVKLKGIDDTDFSKNIFYPKDLVKPT